MMESISQTVKGNHTKTFGGGRHKFITITPAQNKPKQMKVLKIYVGQNNGSITFFLSKGNIMIIETHYGIS